MSCGYQLQWYDLIPLFSWLMLGGKCRKCRASISPQYPIVEAVNGGLYMLIFAVNGMNLVSVLYCLMASALLALSVIDFRTYEIPFGFNVFLGVLGLIRLATDLSNWQDYVIGFFVISVALEILLIASKGRAIGGGDVKLMPSCGLIRGWKLIMAAVLVGCILGSVIHIIRREVSNAEHMLAMGPYLSAGILISALWGNGFITWYLSLLGI